MEGFLEAVGLPLREEVSRGHSRQRSLRRETELEGSVRPMGRSWDVSRQRRDPGKCCDVWL